METKRQEERSQKQDEPRAIPVDYFIYHERRRGSNHNWVTQDHNQRSSSSSSSGSGKQLVRTHGSPIASHSPKLGPLRIHPASFYGRLERHRWEREQRDNNQTRRETRGERRGRRRTDGYHDEQTHIHVESPSPPKDPTPHYSKDIDLPSSSNSSSIYKIPTRRNLSALPQCSPPSSPYFTPHPLPSIIFTHDLHPGLLTGNSKDVKRNSTFHHPSWRIPRASAWCPHKKMYQESSCSQCQLKDAEDDDLSSTCSSENPPPTFTLEKYMPNRTTNTSRCSWCSCSAVFVATTAFSTLILLLIAAFILYIEMVLKRTEYVPDPM